MSLGRFRYGATLMALFLVASAGVQAASLGSLMKTAIDAPDGRASGVLDDRVAALIVRATGSTAPVTAQIETIHAFQQAGCRRLQATLSQPVPEKPDAVFSFEMNLCRDGAAPREGVDLGQAAGQLSLPQSVR